MVGFLNASAKLAIVWIINPGVLLYIKPNCAFDLSCFSFFIVNFVHLELILFYIEWILDIFIRE